jgi:hypothetical protein
MQYTRRQADGSHGGQKNGFHARCSRFWSDLEANRGPRTAQKQEFVGLMVVCHWRPKLAAIQFEVVIRVEVVIRGRSSPI